jgi:hypothetical protein
MAGCELNAALQTAVKNTARMSLHIYISAKPTPGENHPTISDANRSHATWSCNQRMLVSVS